ncbi:MAG: ABC transporter permease subunit [Chloroflexota bacterium]
MHRISVLVKKEWYEVFKHRSVLLTVLLVPLIMTAIPLAILFSMRADMGVIEASAEMPGQMTAFCPANLSSGECFQVFLVSQFMIMFMLLPLSIPSTIAAYSITGEKTTRSLEPLLATPITTVQLLVGKGLAAVLPAALATYLAFGAFALGAWLLVPNRDVLRAMLDARWLLAVFLVGPLLAVLSVTFSLMVSSRANDPRVAEQISAVIIVPVLAVFFGQIAGLFVLNSRLVLLIGLALVLIDALMVYMAVQLFQRETILTRWK